jgi:putative acetyltransferase
MTRRVMRPEILIRSVEVDDWEDIAAIHESASVVYHTLQLPYPSRDAIRDRLENIPTNEVKLVAVVNGVVVGVLGLHLDSGRRAHTARLGMMVHGDYQGRGVGTALLEAALDLAERWLAISRVELEVFADNEAAIALYRKFGFEIEGTLRDFAFRDGQYADAYLMARVRPLSGEGTP